MENQPPITGRPWFRLLSQVRADSALQPAPSASRPPIQQPPAALARPTVPQPQTTPPQPQPLPPQTQTPSLPSQSPQPQPLAPLSQVPPPPPQTTIQPQPLAPLSQVSPPPPQRTIQPQPSPLTQVTTPPISSVGTVEPPQILRPPTIIVPRSRTPPQSPRDIKPSSPRPPLSPMVKQLQPMPPAQQTVNPEPEPKPLLPPHEPKNTAAPTEDIKEGINSHSQSDLRAPPPTKNDDKNAALDARGPLKAAASKKEEDTMSIITLAGDNTGAYMELRPHQYHQYQHSGKMQGEHSSPGHDDKVDTEGKSRDKAIKAAATKNKSISTHVNSNVQSVNNSILFNSSCNAHSPGVHIVLNSRRGKSRALISSPVALLQQITDTEQEQQARK